MALAKGKQLCRKVIKIQKDIQLYKQRRSNWYYPEITWEPFESSIRPFSAPHSVQPNLTRLSSDLAIPGWQRLLKISKNTAAKNIFKNSRTVKICREIEMLSEQFRNNLQFKNLSKKGRRREARFDRQGFVLPREQKQVQSFIQQRECKAKLQLNLTEYVNQRMQEEQRVGQEQLVELARELGRRKKKLNITNIKPLNGASS